MATIDYVHNKATSKTAGSGSYEPLDDACVDTPVMMTLTIGRNIHDVESHTPPTHMGDAQGSEDGYARVRGTSTVSLEEEDAPGNSKKDAPPYSFEHEVKYFFGKGIPLGLSAILKWGVPPLANMAFAGHTEGSADLQTALGYARVTYNIGCIMILLGFVSYFNNVIPGCIGAGRKDRIPTYLRRSLLLCALCMLPFWTMQLFAPYIVEGLLGASPHIAVMVGTYCRIMIFCNMLGLLEMHLECIFVNLGYARCATFNSFCSGLGVDVLCSYTLVYYLDLGTAGAALTQLVVRLTRLLVWLAFATYYDLSAAIWRTESITNEPILSWPEIRMFFSLGLPQIASNFSGWFVFELQLMLLARVSGITDAAIAAGAVWVMLEQCYAAVQTGWIQIVSMRSLVLLGKQDPHAQRAHQLIASLSILVVFFTNLPLLLYPDQIAMLLTNDPVVQQWFQPMIWVLVVHSQARIVAATGGVLFIPLGKACMKLCMEYFCYYVVAMPIAAFIALSDEVTDDVSAKMLVCVGCTTVGMGLSGTISHIYLCCMDWHTAGAVINARANTDKKAKTETKRASDGDAGDRNHCHRGGMRVFQCWSSNTEMLALDEEQVDDL